MPIYKYRAVNDTGQELAGTYTSGDKSVLIESMREKGYYITNLEVVKERRDADVMAALRKVKVKDLAVFCRQFYTMLNAGVTIIKALDILQFQTENVKLRETTSKLYEEVQKGASLSTALKNHRDVFPDLLINMVEAGEASGTLDNVMERMASQFEKENKLRNKVKSAMVYPIVLSVLAVGVVFFLLTFIMPTFISMFTSSGVELPLLTRIMLGISGFLQHFWYILVFVIAALVYILKKYLDTEKGRMAWDSLMLRLPVVKGLLSKIITARFTRTLSTLLFSGIPLLQAMEIVARICGNKVAEQGIMNAREEVRQGMDLATPVKRIGVFPPMVDSMIKIGEESGTLDDLLEKTANFYDDEVETALQRAVTLLEPLLIVVMGGMIGFIVISMYLPMFELMKTVQ